MQYQITSDNMDLTPSMESLTKDKFSKIESRLSDISEDSKSIRVVLNKAQTREDKFTVKAVINADGKEYFSDETDYSLESAIIRTVEELVRMMSRDKQKDWDEIREAKLNLPQDVA